MVSNPARSLLTKACTGRADIRMLARPLRPVGPFDAGGPDPAGIALAAAPGAVAGSRAHHARMIADQDGLLPQGVPCGTVIGHHLEELMPADPVVPI